MVFAIAIALSNFGAFCLAEPPAVSQEKSQYELGATIQLLLPNRFPDLDTTFAVYGPHLGVALGPGVLYFQGSYGYSESVSLLLGEMNYRLPLKTPFFLTLVEFGPHLLYYRKRVSSHTKVGAQVGYGFILSADKAFDITLEMKIYFQDRTILSFGGGFLFLL